MNKPINSNLRHLKVVDAEFYRMKTGLCAACGNCYGCSIQGESVQVCTDYQPVIPFKKLDGLEARFNTFRLGFAWSTRVKPGQSIGLLNREGVKFGEAVVEAVHRGDKDEMLAEHAAFNHLLIASPHEKPAQELKRLIRNLYGPNYLANADGFTVIYLNRTS